MAQISQAVQGDVDSTFARVCGDLALYRKQG
jgi:hypothetical protein